MDYLLAPSFRDKKVLCEPYEKNGKMYVKIQGASGPREVRAYDKPQAAWQKKQDTAMYVEFQEDCVLLHNYPVDRYSDVIGIREDENGNRGVWFYRELPEAHSYSTKENIILSPVLGYHGSILEPPVERFNPTFVSEKEICMGDNKFRRLVTATWWKKEIERLHRIYNE